jgi:hypothetical protein
VVAAAGRLTVHVAGEFLLAEAGAAADAVASGQHAYGTVVLVSAAAQ